MASTWSALKVELLETGQNSGTWGTLTNVNLGDAVLGEAITGSATVDFPADADVTITLTDAATTQAARNLRLNITESGAGIGSVRNLILGSGCQIEKFYLINNTGTGAKTVKNTSGTGISVPAGKATLVYNNGTNVVDAASYFTSLTLGSALPVASGGTGLTSFGTGVATALGINTGSSGAFVVNGGALGVPSSGTVTNLTGTASININGTVGATTAATGAFTTLTATADSSFTSTGALVISKGTTGQRPTPASGMLRFNTTTTEFEGYNGTAWASVGGAALSNDTSTATDVFPLFANATTGTASTLFTGNASLLYKPSTGELKASVPVASNGIVVNSQTVATSYTIAAGFAGSSVGPITVNSGVVVTVSSGSRWVVL